MTEPLRRRTGGQILIDQLKIHGVDMAFGVPGESYLAALDALFEARNQIRCIREAIRVWFPTRLPLGWIAAQRD